MSFDGNYNISVFPPKGEFKDQLTLKTTGDNVSGTYTTRLGTTTLPLLDMKVNGNELSWHCVAPLMPEGELLLPFKVTIAGDKITGTISVKGEQPFKVVGERVK